MRTLPKQFLYYRFPWILIWFGRGILVVVLLAFLGLFFQVDHNLSLLLLYAGALVSYFSIRGYIKTLFSKQESFEMEWYRDRVGLNNECSGILYKVDRHLIRDDQLYEKIDQAKSYLAKELGGNYKVESWELNHPIYKNLAVPIILFRCSSEDFNKVSGDKLCQLIDEIENILYSYSRNAT